MNKHYSLIVLVFFIASCGGGSGSSASSSASSSSSSIVNVFRTVEVTPMFTTPLDTNDGTSGRVETYVPDETGTWVPAGTYSLTTSGVAKVSLAVGRTYLLELKGACYVDRSFDLGGALTRTPTTICMDSNEALRAVVVADYNTSRINMTLFTEIAAGLALHDHAQGVSPLNAITHANAVVSAWIQTDVFATQPVTFDSTTLATPASNYAALLLGAGSWLKQSAQALGGGHYGSSPYTPSSFFTLAGADVQADGILDGMSIQGPTSVGALPLGAIVYRHQTAAYGMRAVRWLYDPSNANRRGVSKTFIPALVASNDFDDPLFGSGLKPALDENGPVLTGNSMFDDSPNTQTLEYPAVVTITDIVGVPVGGIRIYIDDILYDQPLVPFLLGLTHYGINTTIFRNGPHKVTVAVTNNLGTVTSQSVTMTFQNNCAVWPRACL